MFVCFDKNLHLNLKHIRYNSSCQVATVITKNICLYAWITLWSMRNYRSYIANINIFKIFMIIFNGFLNLHYKYIFRNSYCYLRRQLKLYLMGFKFGLSKHTNIHPWFYCGIVTILVLDISSKIMSGWTYEVLYN